MARRATADKGQHGLIGRGADEHYVCLTVIQVVSINKSLLPRISSSKTTLAAEPITWPFTYRRTKHFCYYPASTRIDRLVMPFNQKSFLSLATSGYQPTSDNIIERKLL